MYTKFIHVWILPVKSSCTKINGDLFIFIVFKLLKEIIDLE